MKQHDDALNDDEVTEAIDDGASPEK